MSEASPLERLVMPVAVAVVRNFIEEHHYSKSINGCKVSMAFALYEAGEMVGAVLFGPLSTTAWKRYGEKEGDVVELRRLVCLDRCPRNTESWLIAKCLRVLKRETGYKVCVSYADPHHGHCGTIYQAANWNYEGQTAPDVLLQTPEGRLYHSRALRTKYNGDFKPFVKRLRKLQEDGLLTEVAVPGKHIYTYALRGKQRPTQLPYPKGITHALTGPRKANSYGAQLTFGPVEQLVRRLQRKETDDEQPTELRTILVCMEPRRQEPAVPAYDRGSSNCRSRATGAVEQRANVCGT